MRPTPSGNRLSPDSYIPLFTRYQAGDEAALAEILLLFEPHIALLAEPYVNAGFDPKLAMEEAGDAAAHAARHYEISKGYPFEAYSTVWIRQRLLKTYTRSHADTSARDLQRAEKLVRLMKETDEVLTTADITAKTGFNGETLLRVYPVALRMLVKPFRESEGD